MKRRILLVDDEVTILLTLKAVLEISGFDVDTAASAREGRSKLRTREYHMVITDMRMESEVAGVEVIQAARTAPYKPAVALLTAFPVAEDDWQEMGADRMLVKPVHTRILLQQIENLLQAHGYGSDMAAAPAAGPAKKAPAKAVPPAPKKAPAKKSSAKKAPAKAAAKKSSVKKSSKKAAKSAAKRAPRKAAKKVPAKKAVARSRRPAAKKAARKRR
jgi:DNA-binding response OmpR family regulator